MRALLLLNAPPQAGSREQARDLVRDLQSELAGSGVVIDCSQVRVATPSFLDEIVKEVLEKRHADSLEARDAPDRTQRLLERAAENRGLRERLRAPARSTP